MSTYSLRRFFSQPGILWGIDPENSLSLVADRLGASIIGPSRRAQTVQLCPGPRSRRSEARWFSWHGRMPLGSQAATGETASGPRVCGSLGVRPEAPEKGVHHVQAQTQTTIRQGGQAQTQTSPATARQDDRGTADH